MIKDDSLKGLFSPRTIAIAGMQEGRNSFNKSLRGLSESGRNEDIFIIDPEVKEFPGLRVFKNLFEIPQIPDVAYYLGAYVDLEEFIEMCGSKKIPNIVISSFPESTGDDEFRRNQIIDTARSSGVRLLGPGSLGIVDFTQPAPISFFPYLENRRNSFGGTALISQSPTFALSGYNIAAERGVGLRYLVNTGSEYDLDMVDLGRYLLDDQGVSLIVFSIEQLQRGRRFLAFVEEARQKNVAVAVLKAGRYKKNLSSDVASTAVLSEGNRIWESALMQYGVIEIMDINEIAGLSYLLDGDSRPAGNSVGILSFSKGAELLMADRCNEKGLYRGLGPNQKNGECSGSDRIAIVGNDSGLSCRSFFMDYRLFAKKIREMRNSLHIDIIVVIFPTVIPGDFVEYEEAITEVFSPGGKPLVCVWLPGRPDKVPEMKSLRGKGIPVYASISACARALESFVRWTCFKEEKRPWCLLDITIPAIEFDEKLTEYSAKRLLSDFGVPITMERICKTLDEALRAAEEIGYPVALKVMSPDIIRKSRARVIALDLNNAEEVRNAYGRTLERASRSNPGAEITGVLVQEMLQDGMECMIGARRDEVFGPIISVGIGGIYVEFLDDYSTRLAPVSVESACEMIDELKGSPLLKGVWGRKGLDTLSLASMVSRLSNIIFLHEDILEINVNPVFVRQDDALVVDAFIVRR